MQHHLNSSKSTTSILTLTYFLLHPKVDVISKGAPWMQTSSYQTTTILSLVFNQMSVVIQIGIY